MQILGAHAGDVCSMSIRYEENVIVTGSVDRSIKIWDLRDLKCVQTFYGHDADVNSVYFHPTGKCFVSGSEDKTSRLFDMRSDQQVNVFRPPTANSRLIRIVSILNYVSIVFVSVSLL